MIRRLIFFAWMFALPVSIAHAENVSLKLPNPLGCSGAADQPVLCITKILINALYFVAVPATVIMVMWAGFQFLTAGGNEEKISSARKTLLYTAIGFAVIVLSGAFRAMIEGLLAVD